MNRSERPDLAAARRRVLAAAAARILPSDDGPGAVETGIADYIVEALEEPVNRHIAPLLERGFDFLQALAEGRHGVEFSACSAEQQDAILREAQRFPNNDARRFFEDLILLCIEGFLCHPRHGGNRDFLGWDYLGYSSAALEVGNCPRRELCTTRS